MSLAQCPAPPRARSAMAKKKVHVTLKRSSSGASAAGSAAHTGSASTDASSASESRGTRRPSKLNANRARRQRERSLDDDDLDQKFGNLGFNTQPISVTQQHPRPRPAAKTGLNRARSASTTAATATQGKRASLDLQGRQKSNAPGGAARPRRQRIGTMGFNKPTGGVAPPSATAVSSAKSNAAANRSRSVSAPSAINAKRTFTFTHEPSASAPTEDGAAPRRGRSDSAGSDSDYSSSDDEVYPEEAATTSSAFPNRLALLVPQKRIPKRVSRDAVIDTIFAALFKKKPERDPSGFHGVSFGDDTGTDTDEPNEEFVKRGLAASLFKDGLGTPIKLERRGHETEQQAVDRFITPKFVHTLVNDMRFEDFRTASARIDVLRAIHKNCPGKRIHIARALADATHLRLEYVTALTYKAHTLAIEKNKAIVDNKSDHGHGFTELLRYAIEHVGERRNGFTFDIGANDDAPTEAEVAETMRNYMMSLMYLWRAHWLDTAGSDEEELISCAGQFAAYMPDMSIALIGRILRSWPTKYPGMEVHAIRMLARVLMTSPPLHQIDKDTTIHVDIFARLAKCIQSPHVQVAQEALAFTGCQFVLLHFVGTYPEVYAMVSSALHNNVLNHWHETIKSSSESNFDRALDFA
ncbi:TPA: hypothetical protein N0F65_003678 [Lagenidium giganteum]|uniref:Uncharacterized protein n=1 Tax=Lagenidium giganteum TaxID=4803 RepID=A0AAV2YV96_9STRA|nr:TPA: hypothetical protein N0F65_003678 [Lagenidium giganteum]